MPQIEPDTGRILGFFVRSALLGTGDLFLQSTDIVSWGTKIHVRSDDRLSPPEELIRLQSAFSDTRTMLGQVIRAKDTKRIIGVCADVQFNTRHFMVEWLFPRRFFLTKQPLPVTDILEVTEDGIWVKDPVRPVKEKEVKEKKMSLPKDPVTDVLPALGRSSR